MDHWKSIVGFPAYEVSINGQIRRVLGGRGSRPNAILKNSKDANGYAVVNLYLPDNGGARKVYVHQIVARAFLHKPEGAHQIAHWDGDGMNAAASNLRWVTQSENEADKVRHGRNNYAPKGSRRFSPKEVQSIRALLAKGMSARAIGKLFGAAHNTVLAAARNGSSTPR
jgi:DNA-binding NarL/FixJ family response regulator